MEIWKDAIGYEGLYQISNIGNVKSLKFELIRELKKNKAKKGYLNVYFTKNKKVKGYQVHRLVALNFINNPFDLKEVNHIDGNKENNHESNLEWVSTRENSCHSRLNSKSSSKHIGVCFNKENNNWRSYIHFEKKLKCLGSYESEQEAFEARLRFESDNKIVNKYITIKSDVF